MKNKIVFLAVLIFLPLLSLPLMASVAADPAALPSTCTIPAWIKTLAVPTAPIAPKPSQVNFQCLLMDTQRNWEDKTLYHHRAIKAVTNRGVETISKLQIDFDPSFSKICMHAIRIFRNGQWYDRLEQARFQLIQREVGLKQISIAESLRLSISSTTSAKTTSWNIPIRSLAPIHFSIPTSVI